MKDIETGTAQMHKPYLDSSKINIRREKRPDQESYRFTFLSTRHNLRGLALTDGEELLGHLAKELPAVPFYLEPESISPETLDTLLRLKNGQIVCLEDKKGEVYYLQRIDQDSNGERDLIWFSITKNNNEGEIVYGLGVNGKTKQIHLQHGDENFFSDIVPQLDSLMDAKNFAENQGPSPWEGLRKSILRTLKLG